MLNLEGVTLHGCQDPPSLVMAQRSARTTRIVVANASAPRDGRFIDEVGRYNPCTEPAMIKFDLEKVDKWIANGAQPTDTVARLLKIAREDA